MSSYIFDIETNDLLDNLTTIHCIVAKDIETGVVLRSNSVVPSYMGGLSIEDHLKMLAEADELWGHNIVRFDLKAIQKLYPGWTTRAKIRDTQVCAQLIWPVDLLKPIDASRAAKGKFPKQLMGRHSLEAWGHRIGEYKSEKISFEKWSKELEDYCVQDVEVTAVLRQRIIAKQYSEQALQLEHDVAEINFEQEQNGAPFDEDQAQKLYASLVQTRLDIERELIKTFGSFYLPNGITVPKRDNKKQGITAGCEYQKLKLVEFNPGSRDHIANRLIHMRGWKPVEYTDDGKPKVDEAIISKLPYPEAKPLKRYLLVQKRIGQLAEGKEALIKKVVDGRIHGRVIGNGAITGRATHSQPNLAQVPKVKKGTDKQILMGEAGSWGWEFRNLFYAPPGWLLVGADASGLELRMLGHYVARYDGGEYANVVVNGDVHSITVSALGAICIIVRDTAKTWIYAWLYGAGDEKLGKILRKGMKAGSLSRKLFLDKIPALGRLVAAVKAKHRAVKHLIGLDKRILHTRSEHAALNTLLQGGGAITCKVWLTILHRKLRERGWRNGADYMQILWVHDEVQILARPEIADEVGKIAVEAVREAGRSLGLRCPLDGEYKVGRTWAETH